MISAQAIFRHSARTCAPPATRPSGYRTYAAHVTDEALRQAYIEQSRRTRNGRVAEFTTNPEIHHEQ